MKIKTNIEWNGGWKCTVGSNFQALALYRIVLGFLLFCELALRFRFLKPFYSDQGTLPNHILLPQIDSLYRLICVHAYCGSLLYQQILLGVQCLFALSLMLGYETTISSVVSWFLYLSLTLKNTWLNFILDRYFHYLLFYAMFLPLDGAWSIDKNKRNQKKNDSNASSTIVNLATFALKVQVLWIYLDAGSGKYMDPLGGWTLNADPLPALDTYARHTIVARYMYSLLGPAGLRLLTPTVVYVEMFCVPIALIGSFIGNQTVVLAMIGTICSLHIGISMTVRNTVLLSSVACCAWCPFLPPLTKIPKDQIVEPKTHSDDSGETSIQYTGRTKKKTFLSLIIIPILVSGSIWFETMSEECNQSMKHIWSVLLHNRWNVFVGAEEYVTWEIAPGRLADGSVVDVWGRKNDVDWDMPGTGAPCTSTARPGRWRSYPYLAEIEGEAGEILWNYLCKQWDEENNVSENSNSGRRLLRYNFFMLQADVLPNMGFSATRKRLIHSHDCKSTRMSSIQDVRPAGHSDL